eukprot:m.196522 g.196522  ORF g.196522 m.196522 type:complete len:83 (+) comp39531_c0_seq3:137-385(+)
MDGLTTAPAKKPAVSTVPDPTKEELTALFDTLIASGKPAVLSIVPPYSDLYVLPELPAPLSSLYNDKLIYASFPDILEECNS